MGMIVQVESSGRINPDDVIVFKNGKWVNITKGEFLASTFAYVSGLKDELDAEINALNGKISELEQLRNQDNSDLAEYKAKINEKLKEHHNVLNALSK